MSHGMTSQEGQAGPRVERSNDRACTGPSPVPAGSGRGAGARTGVVQLERLETTRTIQLTSRQNPDSSRAKRSDLREQTEAMTTLKVCLLGATQVGKTRLVERLVNGCCAPVKIYRPTGIVRIDRKRLAIGLSTVDLLLWDLPGEQDGRQMPLRSLLRGASGYLLVADATDSSTLDAALRLQARTLTIGDAYATLPWTLVLNKIDLTTDAPSPEDLTGDYLDGAKVVIARTSAITGAGVEDAFGRLVRRILTGQPLMKAGF